MKGLDLGKMIGPLPLGAWIGVTGGGLFLASRAHKAAGTAATAPATPAATDTVPVSSGVSGGSYGALTTLPATPFSGIGGSATTQGPATSNSDWLQGAVNGLVGRGYLGYSTAQALEAYLEGNQLTADQARVVESAIKLFGLPPDPPMLAPAPIPDPGSTTPAPLVAAPPPPPPAAPTPPPPAPVNTFVTNLPSDLVTRISGGGEAIVKSLPWAAGPPGSGWWLGSYGGVFAVGGAPFRGSAVNFGFGPPGGRRATDIEPSGPGGYRITSNYGENYDFPG